MFQLFFLSFLLQTPEAHSERLAAEAQVLVRRLDGRVTSCLAQKVLEGSSERKNKYIVVQEIQTDPYGFKFYLDGFRHDLGLCSLRYDSNLSSWATQNNIIQNQRGLGHYVNPNCWQNSGWNYSDTYSVFLGWYNSPGHRSAMMANVTSYGIAHGPGPYWTLNLR